MRALVTGGCGFIGSHLVDKLLSMKAEVVVLDNMSQGNKLSRDALDHVRLIQGDVVDRDTVMEAASGCTYIFHLASVLGVDVVASAPVLTMETEVSSVQNVAAAAIYHGCKKLMYASTSGVYGKAGIDMAVDEDFLVSPSSSYAIGKRYNEIYLQALYHQKRLESVSLRFFNVYGPRQDDRMVIPRFVEQAFTDEDITVFGDGSQTRDFTYIDDTVDAIILSTMKVKGCEVLNVAAGVEFSINELAEEIVELTSANSTIIHLDRPDREDFEVARRVGSSAKLERLTGFMPKTGRKDGLKKTIDYMREANEGVAV